MTSDNKRVNTDNRNDDFEVIEITDGDDMILPMI